MPIARIAQLVERRICNAKVGGSTPSLGTISHECPIASAPLYAGSLLSFEHLSCVGARGSTPSVGTISKKVEGSPADYASLLRRPVQVHLPWLPARPVASALALKHRSRPSLGTISLPSYEHLSCVGRRDSMPSTGALFNSSKHLRSTAGRGVGSDLFHWPI